MRYLPLAMLLVACDPAPQPDGPPQPGPAIEQPAPAPEPEPQPTAAPSGSAPSSGEYNPCVGRPCGSACNVCPPDAKDCIETAVLKQCNEQGQCMPETAKCTPR
jgi:hypothetical protein